MSFDERALLVEQELRLIEAPRRLPGLDGPVWLWGPLALALLVAAILALALPLEPPGEPIRGEPPEGIAQAVSSGFPE
jgi:hypothetical protein